VNNTSGEDWKDTRLWLTTGEPPVCGNMISKFALQTNVLHAKQNKSRKLNLDNGLNQHLNELDRMGSEVMCHIILVKFIKQILFI
jgi:hypothetical protein